MNPNLVAHPDVVKAVTGTLRKKGRTRAQLEDDVPEVQTRTLEAARRGPVPADVGEWKALATTIAVRYAKDQRELAKTRAKYEEGLCEEPDKYGPIERHGGRDPVDTERYLDVLKELFDRGEMPEQGAEILWGVAEGVPIAEIAQETGLTRSQVKGRLERMRIAFKANLARIGMLTLVVVYPLVLLTVPAPLLAVNDREHEPDRAPAVRAAA